MTKRRSVPFSIHILTLMALIVVPLSSTLLWLGWRAVDRLELRDVEQGMSALDDAVIGFLGNGLRIVVLVGQAMGEAPAFSAEAVGTAADDERLRQLAAVLRRHPSFLMIYRPKPAKAFGWD